MPQESGAVRVESYILGRGSGGGQTRGLAAGFVGGREGCGHGVQDSGVGAAGFVEGGAEQLDAGLEGPEEPESLHGIASGREFKDHRQVVGEFAEVEPPSAGRIDLLDPGQRVAASSSVAVGVVGEVERPAAVPAVKSPVRYSAGMRRVSMAAKRLAASSSVRGMAPGSLRAGERPPAERESLPRLNSSTLQRGRIGILCAGPESVPRRLACADRLDLDPTQTSILVGLFALEAFRATPKPT